MSKPFSNPFFEADFSKFMDMSKFMGDFKVPTFNFEAFLSTQRRNIEAMTAMNQAAFESMQALARRQADLMRQGVEEATSLVNAVMATQSPEEKVMRQAEASKVAVDKCLANVRDITETLTKCNYQAIDTVSNRLTESLEELRGIMKPSQAA